MGWRYKKAGATRAKELWPPAIPASKTPEAMKTLPLTGGRLPTELAVPPLARVGLSCRQLGSFRGKKIYETGLSLSQMH